MPVGAPVGDALQAGVVETVTQRPVLLVGGVVAVIAILVAGWYIASWFRRTPAERFRNAVASRDAITVLLHPNPDPDAMAAGLATVRIAADVDTDATLQYPGQIRHQENRAFENVLDVDAGRVETASDLSTDAVVLVDHNEPRGFTGAGSLDPIAVVDHHPGGGKGSRFTDVRPEYGACATIFAEYLEAFGHEPDGDPDLPTELATGLLYGVLSDTKNLTRGASQADFRACSYLNAAVDVDALDRIANPGVSADVLEVKARAVMERETNGSFVVSDVGEVGNVDALSQAADELSRLEGITAVVVFGDHDGTLHLSGRSRDDRVHMGRTLQSVVEDISMAEAGGHPRMGGGQLSVEHMVGIGPGDGISREDLQERLFDAMAGDI